MISVKVTNVRSKLDINLQLIASELDTDVNYLKCIYDELLEDAITKKSFDDLCLDIKRECEITSFDDNTVMYEYENEAVVIHEYLGIKCLIFDSMNSAKIENAMNRF